MKNIIKQKQLVHIIDEAVNNKVFPGCVIGIRTSEQQLVLPFGKITYDGDSDEVKPETLYDVASITKSIPTACIALHLIETSCLALYDKVETYLPQLKQKKTGQLRIFDLLTSRINFGMSISEYKRLPAKKIFDIIFDSEWSVQTSQSVAKTHFSSILANNTGQSPVVFTNPAFILLGLVVEAVVKKPLNEYAEDYFFKPLKMEKTGWKCADFITVTTSNTAKHMLVAPTEVDDWRGEEIRGQVHDETAWRIQRQTGKVIGSAGLFSTVPDLLLFLDMILHLGESQNHQYLQPETIRQMAQNQVSVDGLSAGLGWEVGALWANGMSSIIGKTGFTGCLVALSLEKKIGLVILSNATYPVRPIDRYLISNLRKKICEFVFFQ